MSEGTRQRDGWDKLQILLDPFGKILTAVLVVGLGIMGNTWLQADQKRRAYVELLSRREEADGTLRKDMFSKVIDVFVGQDNKADLDSRILNLELLTYNFHESIDLAPLLKHVYEQTWTDESATTQQRKRLRGLAQEIVNRELVALSANDCSSSADIDFDTLKSQGAAPGFLEVHCAEQNGLPAKTFILDVMANPLKGELRRQPELDVALKVHSSDPRLSDEERDQVFAFTLSPFDFPLIDNVRLGDRGRAAVVMKRSSETGATIAFAYFPDSRTSLRDKPFQDEVMKTLELRD